MASYQSVLSSRKGMGLSGTGLKVLALLFMTVDHFAVIIIQNGKLYGYVPEYYEMAIATPLGQRWLLVYRICRLIGRLAFPLFAFLLVEGFLQTSDFWRYFRRMLLMALAAEVPYDLAFFNETYHFAVQNVGWTFTVTLLGLYGMKRFRRHTLLSWGALLLAALAAELLHFEYGAVAVLSAGLLYLFRKEKGLRMLSGALGAALNSYESCCLGALAYILIFFYNGERGRFHSRWFFYLYYPLHLLIMYLMIYVGAMITT